MKSTLLKTHHAYRAIVDVCGQNTPIGSQDGSEQHVGMGFGLGIDLCILLWLVTSNGVHISFHSLMSPEHAFTLKFTLVSSLGLFYLGVNPFCQQIGLLHILIMS